MGPEMIDGDIFKVIVPLDDGYSYEAGITSNEPITNMSDTVKDTVKDTVNDMGCETIK